MVRPVVEQLRPKKPFDKPPPGAVVVEPGKLPALVDAAEAALIAADEPIYARGGGLVKIAAVTKKSRAVDRELGAPNIFSVESAHLRERLSAATTWCKFDARNGNYRLVDPPAYVAEALLARREWNLRPLVGLIESPTLRPDGSLLEREGYDEATGLVLVARPAGWEGLPDTPGQRDAVDAIELLCGAFATLPYESPEDESALIAAIITALIRRALPAAPLLAVNAPEAGTGKTKVADAVGILATGRRPAALALGDDGAELEKRIGTVLLSGDPVILIDNIERTLRSDLLCQVATQPVVQIRILGATNRALLTTRATILLTGNNLVVRGDLTRRILQIRINARVEQPELRRFASDLVHDVSARRAELVRAALTIPRAYLAAGSPAVDIPPYGSFGEWDAMVRRPLVWAGLPDPLLTSRQLRDDDPDREALRAVLHAWERIWGRRTAATAAQIAELCARPGTDGLALHDAVSLAIKDITARSVGYWLRANRERPSGELRLVRLDAGRYGAEWAVVGAGDPSTTAVVMR